MAQLTIRSEITGTLWKVVVQEGDSVEEDDTLMILESMKMEIPVVAPDAGRVSRILVSPGDSVREGQDLAVIDLS